MSANGEIGRPTVGFVRGYFAGWSDARAGREYGGTRPSGWDVWPTGEAHEQAICGIIAPHQGPNGEPLACAWPDDHLPDIEHSWAWVPTVLNGGSRPPLANTEHGEDPS